MIPATVFALEARRLAAESRAGTYDEETAQILEARSVLAWQHARRAHAERSPVRITLREVR